MVVTSVLLGYLIGSVSFVGIISRLLGVDPWEEGEGHLGASSLLKATGSVPLFVLAALLDATKGSLALALFGEWGLVGALLGHMFPFFFAFRGGNGVSVYYGGAALVAPVHTPVALVAEALTWKTIKSETRHAIYMAVRAFPAVAVPELLTAYAVLLARHVWFYRLYIFKVIRPPSTSA